MQHGLLICRRREGWIWSQMHSCHRVPTSGSKPRRDRDVTATSSTRRGRALSLPRARRHRRTSSEWTRLWCALRLGTPTPRDGRASRAQLRQPRRILRPRFLHRPPGGSSVQPEHHRCVAHSPAPQACPPGPRSQQRGPSAARGRA